MVKYKKLLKPLFLLGLYLILLIFISSKIPNPQIFIEKIKELYFVVGYPLIFLSALLEALFLVGFYIPGSTVILLGAAMAKVGVVGYFWVFIFGTLGLMTGYIVNYSLGRHGWYHLLTHLGFKKGVEMAKRRIEKDGVKAIFLGYFFPGSASLFSTAAGILHMPFKKFLLISFLAQSFWGLIWGNLAYSFGFRAIELIMKYFIFLLIAIGIIWLIGKRR